MCWVEQAKYLDWHTQRIGAGAAHLVFPQFIQRRPHSSGGAQACVKIIQGWNPQAVVCLLPPRFGFGSLQKWLVAKNQVG